MRYPGSRSWRCQEVNMTSGYDVSEWSIMDQCKRISFHSGPNLHTLCYQMVSPPFMSRWLLQKTISLKFWKQFFMKYFHPRWDHILFTTRIYSIYYIWSSLIVPFALFALPFHCWVSLTIFWQISEIHRPSMCPAAAVHKKSKSVEFKYKIVIGFLITHKMRAHACTHAHNTNCFIN